MGCVQHIHMMQSGHGGGHDVPVWDWIARDYALAPIKPTLDAEPNYEDHPVNPWPTWDPANGYFRDADVRRQCYRSVFAGGCGVIYGHHAVWQFWEESRPVINHADRDWREAIDRPGAFQVGYLRCLMETWSFATCIPDPKIIVSEAGEGASHITALREVSGRHALIYIPPGRTMPLAMRLELLAGPNIEAIWFDPINGREIGTTDTCCATEVREYKIPIVEQDWVLILKSV